MLNKLSCCLKHESYKLVPEKVGAHFFPVNFDSKSIALISGQNDWAAFQVILKYNCDYAVNIGTMPYFSHKLKRQNFRIAVLWEDALSPAPEIKVKLIECVTDDDGLKKADIILNQDVLEAGAEALSAVWVEIPSPETTPPGTYKGCVNIYSGNMFEGEQLTEKMHFTLNVLPCTLPKPSEYQFHLDLWQHLTNIARKHDVVLWSDEHFEVLENYVKTLAELGQKAVTVLVSQVPWRGQSCFYEERTPANLFEYSSVKIKKNTQGSFEFDFSVMKRYIDLCFKYGIDSEIELVGITSIWNNEPAGFTHLAPDYPDAMKVRYLDEKTGCYNYMTSAEDLILYVKAIENHFIAEGLIERVRVVADEPQNREDLRKSLSMLKKIAPSFRYKGAINCADMVEEFAEDIDDYVPIISCLAQEWEKFEEYKEKWPQKRFLWYVCCGPDYFNTFIKSNLLESRAIGIFTSYLRFAGFLRWNYTVWNENPRKDIRYSAFPAGDTNFVYPAGNGKVLLSLRYYALKRGIEDYELLEIYRKRFGDKKATDLIRIVIKEADVKKYAPSSPRQNIAIEDLISLNPDSYDQLRRLLLEQL